VLRLLTCACAVCLLVAGAGLAAAFRQLSQKKEAVPAAARLGRHERLEQRDGDPSQPRAASDPGPDAR